MKLSLHVFLTLDGVMQGPGSPTEDTTNGFDRGGWMPPFADDDSSEIVDSWYREADAILLGRNTFQLMRDYWSSVTDTDDLVAGKLNSLPKFVTSTTLGNPGWAHSEVIRKNALERILELKEAPGRELQVHGSHGLAQLLHAAGLIDEYRLLVFPVTVGTGKRLFSNYAPARGLRLIASASTRAGAAYLQYAPADLETGSFVVARGARGVN